MTNITRRAALAGALLSSAALAVPVGKALGRNTSPPPPESPDAALLALGEEFERLWAIERSVLPSDEYSYDAEAWKPWDEAQPRTEAVVTKIEACRATTLEGLRVKARAVIWCHNGRFDGLGGVDGETTDARLAGSIIIDLAGGANA